MIDFSSVSVVYNNSVIGLDNLSFHINRGEFVFLVGKTGAGKSSVIKLLLGEIKPAAGTVTVGSIAVNGLSPAQIPFLRRNIGVVFQDYRLLPKKSVYENVAFAMEIVGAPARDIRRVVPDILCLTGLSSKARRYPSQLSGGEQQRVGIARALVNSPTLVIADEPTGNLDLETASDIMNLFDEINKRGTTVVMVTHSDRIVNYMHKRVIQLEKGVLVRDDERGVYQIGHKEF